MKKNLNEAIEKIAYLEAAFNGGPGSGNFRHAGRLGLVGGSSKKGENVSEPTDLKVVIDGKEMTSSEAKEYLENNKDLEVLDRINSKLGDLRELEKSVLLDKGWVPVEENGKICGEFNDKINRHKFVLGKDDERVMNNGKRYLEDNNDEYYVSKPSNIDGVAIYTTTDKEDALIYADGDESRICRLVVDKSNFISQEKLDEIRKRLSNKADNYKLKYALRKVEGSKHSYCPVKDTILASMYGYDGIIRLGANEYIVMNPERLSLDKTNLSKRMNELISKINGLGCYNKNKEIKKMKLTREQYNFVKQKLEELEKEINGGKGSGNFGHSGRPGYVGGSGKGGLSSDKKDGGSSESEFTPVKMDESTCGIPGDRVLGDDEKVPMLKGLTGKQEKIEKEFAKNWNEKDKREKALKSSEDMAIAKGNKDYGGVPAFETDAIKQLDEKNWGSDKELKALTKQEMNYEIKKNLESRMSEGGKLSKKEAELYENVKDAQPLSDSDQKKADKIRQYRSENNSVLHQTTNAIAKKSFENYMENNKGKTIVVTLGGCASGKGFGLENPSKVEGKTSDGKTFSSIMKKAGVIWDSAGDQGGDELNWIANVAKKSGSDVIFVYTVASPQAAAKNAVGRVQAQGRIVASQTFNESYTKTDKNYKAFQKANKNNKRYTFVTVDNPGMGNGSPKIINGKSPYNNISNSEMSKLIKKEIQNLPPQLRDSANKGADFKFSYK